jgi:hypothetical protein
VAGYTATGTGKRLIALLRDFDAHDERQRIEVMPLCR